MQKKCYRKDFNLSDISETGYGINKFTQFTIFKVLSPDCKRHYLESVKEIDE